MEGDGEATCNKDFESMNSPVVELMTKEDLAPAVKYLNPSLTDSDVAVLFEQGASENCERRSTRFLCLTPNKKTSQVL